MKSVEEQYWELLRNVKIQNTTLNLVNQNLQFNQVPRWFGFEKYYSRKLVSFPDMDFNGSTLFNSAPLRNSHHDAISCFWKQEFKTFLHIYCMLYHMDLSFAIVIIGFGTVKNFFFLVSLILTYSSSCSFLQQKLGFIFPWSDIFHGSASEKWIEIPYNLTPASFYCHLLFSLHSNWIQLLIISRICLLGCLQIIGCAQHAFHLLTQPYQFLFIKIAAVTVLIPPSLITLAHVDLSFFWN